MDGTLRMVRQQPTPIDTRVVHFPGVGQTISTIMRAWAPGDAAHCRLCRRCTARANICIISVGYAVPPGDAPGFSTAGLPDEGEARSSG